MNSSSIQFFDHTLPGLEAGIYSITVTPTLNVDGSQDDATPISQSFTVQGPRFSLPANEVSIQSPAPQSSGEFDTQLPYVLLTSPTLPWERALSSDAQTTTPWLALLVFEDGELQPPPVGSGSADTGTWTTTVSEFLGSASATTVVPQLPVGSVSTEEQALTCQSIQFPATLFKQIAPQLNELSLLAHCRQVSSADQKKSAYGVVLANRFPKAMKDANQDKTQQATIQPVKNIAHLVSLEGCESYLSADYSPEDGQTIRLISLSSWSFICMPYADQNFGQLLTQLMTNAQTGDNISLLRMVPPSGTPADAISPETLTYLTNGYTPHLYKTLSGETTLGWYRGPLTPVVTPQIPALYSPPQNPASTSSDTLLSDSVTGDELFIYNADTGIYDVSYAAAWQIGRQLALADPTFTQALMAFFNSAAASTAPSSDLSVTKQTLIDHLQNGLVDNIGHMLNQPSTNQPPRLFQARPTKVKISPNQRREQQLNALKASPPMTIPSTMVQWLAQLRRFSGLPFTYLLPEEKLLPTESIRFFHVDINWLDAMTAGALTIGIHNGQSKVISGKLFDQLKGQGFNQADPVCGFFLRSAVVSGWPNLRVETNVTLLSSIQLAPDVLFCLFDGIPQQLTLAEPYHQLSFGVSGDTIDAGFVELRNLAGNVGTPLTNDPSSNQLSIASVFRPGDYRVIDFSALTGALTTKGVIPSSQSVGFSSSDMAIELICSPEEVTFTFPSATLTTGISSMLTTRQRPFLLSAEEQSEQSSQSSDSPLLTYALTSNPASPPQTNKRVNLQLIISNNNFAVDSNTNIYRVPVYVKEIDIALTQGESSTDLTSNLASFSASVTDGDTTHQWQIELVNSPWAGFKLTPVNSTFQVIDADGITVSLNNGLVNNQVGTVTMCITEETTDSQGGSPATNDVPNILISKFPDNTFSLKDLLITPSTIIDNNGNWSTNSETSPSSLTVSWQVSGLGTGSLGLTWGDNQYQDVSTKSSHTISNLSDFSDTNGVVTLTATVPLPGGEENFTDSISTSVSMVTKYAGITFISGPDKCNLGETITLQWKTSYILNCSLFDDVGNQLNSSPLSPDPTTNLYTFSISPKTSMTYHVHGYNDEEQQKCVYQNDEWQISVYTNGSQVPVSINVEVKAPYSFVGLKISDDRETLLILRKGQKNGIFNDIFLDLYDMSTKKISEEISMGQIISYTPSVPPPVLLIETELAYMLISIVPDNIPGDNGHFTLSILYKSSWTVPNASDYFRITFPNSPICTWDPNTKYPYYWREDDASADLSVFTDTSNTAACVKIFFTKNSGTLSLNSLPYQVFPWPAGQNPEGNIKNTATSSDGTIYSLANNNDGTADCQVMASYIGPVLVPSMHSTIDLARPLLSFASESKSPENIHVESNETKEDHIPRGIGFFDQAGGLSEPTTNRYSLVENNDSNDVNPPVKITHCCTIH